jgi:hypothetical protein
MDVEVVVIEVVVDIVVEVVMEGEDPALAADAGPLTPPLDAAALAASLSAFFASFFNSVLDGPVVAAVAVGSLTSSVMLDEKSCGSRGPGEPAEKAGAGVSSM